MPLNRRERFRAAQRQLCGDDDRAGIEKLQSPGVARSDCVEAVTGANLIWYHDALLIVAMCLTIKTIIILYTVPRSSLLPNLW